MLYPESLFFCPGTLFLTDKPIKNYPFPYVKSFFQVGSGGRPAKPSTDKKAVSGCSSGTGNNKGYYVKRHTKIKTTLSTQKMRVHRGFCVSGQDNKPLHDVNSLLACPLSTIITGMTPGITKRNDRLQLFQKNNRPKTYNRNLNNRFALNIKLDGDGIKYTIKNLSLVKLILEERRKSARNKRYF